MCWDGIETDFFRGSVINKEVGVKSDWGFLEISVVFGLRLEMFETFGHLNKKICLTIIGTIKLNPSFPLNFEGNILLLGYRKIFIESIFHPTLIEIFSFRMTLKTQFVKRWNRFSKLWKGKK